MTHNERQRIKRAMRLAAMRGFDPYNSHTAHARQYERNAKMDAIRCKSEAEANRWLQRNA